MFYIQYVYSYINTIYSKSNYYLSKYVTVSRVILEETFSIDST